MKVIDIDRVVILMRFIQFGWDEEKRKSFDENLKMMLETQAIDTDVLILKIENLRNRYDKNDFAIRGILEKVLEELREEFTEMEGE